MICTDWSSVQLSSYVQQGRALGASLQLCYSCGARSIELNFPIGGSAVAVPSRLFFVRIQGKVSGPFSAAEIRTMVAKGTIGPGDSVRRDDNPTWHPFAPVNGLFQGPSAAEQTVSPVPHSPDIASPSRKEPSAITQQPVTSASGQQRYHGGNLGNTPNVPGTLLPAATSVTEPKSDNLVRNFAIVAATITSILIALLVVPEIMRDRWELNNSVDVVAKLREADSIRQSNPLAAYKIYDHVITEAGRHNIQDKHFAELLAVAGESRAALFPSVQAMIEKEKAEKKRKAREKAEQIAREDRQIKEAEAARRAAEEDRKLAAARLEQRKKEIKEKAAKYKNASPQARAALNALKRIEARTEVGVSYVNYSQVLGEQYGEVKIFIDSPEGQSMPLFSLRVAEAIQHYKEASENWKRAIDVPMSPGVLVQKPWEKAAAAIKKAEEILLDPEKELELEALP
jgi:hypothetical protein